MFNARRESLSGHFFSPSLQSRVLFYSKKPKKPPVEHGPSPSRSFESLFPYFPLSFYFIPFLYVFRRFVFVFNNRSVKSHIRARIDKNTGLRNKHHLSLSKLESKSKPNVVNAEQHAIDLPSRSCSSCLGRSQTIILTLIFLTSPFKCCRDL